MPDFFDHLDKTCNLELCRLIVFFRGSEEPKEEENWLNGAAAQPTSVKQGFIDSDMKNHCSESEFLRGIQVYPQYFVRVIVDKSGRVA